MTIVTERSFTPVMRTDASDAGLVKIYDNIGAAYPKGTYWCCEGATVSGPKSAIGVEWWVGASFTPKANHIATKIKIAIGYLGGTNEVLVSLNNDAQGIPGTVLRTWTAKALPNAGTCCSVVVKTDKVGIPVTKGTQYWITVTTNASDDDAWAAWNVNDTDQSDSVLSAARCKGTLCRGNNGKWVAVQQTPGLAFAVLGR
jgi:hypothetical protein